MISKKVRSKSPPSTLNQLFTNSSLITLNQLSLSLSSLIKLLISSSHSSHLSQLFCISSSSAIHTATICVSPIWWFKQTWKTRLDYGFNGVTKGGSTGMAQIKPAVVNKGLNYVTSGFCETYVQDRSGGNGYCRTNLLSVFGYARLRLCCS